MKTFVIFDRKTGEILQTHVQAEDHQLTSQKLIQTARPHAEGEQLDVIPVESIAVGTSYRVDTKTKKLVQVEKSKARGMGGAFVQQTAGNPQHAKKIFFPVGEKKKK